MGKILNYKNLYLVLGLIFILVATQDSAKLWYNYIIGGVFLILWRIAVKE